MRLIPDDQFLSWAAEAGLVPDPRYPLSKQLVFPQAPDTWRFWLPPGLPSDLPGFLATALQLAGSGRPFRLRPRGGGPLYYGEHASFREHLIELALRSLDIPLDAAGAIEFDSTEWASTLYLGTAYYTFGWHVGTDLEIVPTQRGCCLMLGHHGDLNVHFATEEGLAIFEAGMAAEGYQLPDEVPDATFKRPPWMRPE
jgi:hypothetical protein